MLDPTVLPSWKENSNNRRKSFFDFLEPSDNKRKPRSNSTGVIEAPRLYSSQRYSYSSPTYETIPYPRQRTKCFAYPSFSNGKKQCESPIVVVTSGSPSVLDYSSMMNNFSKDVGRKYGCGSLLMILVISLTVVFSAGFLYFNGTQLLQDGLIIPIKYFQKPLQRLPREVNSEEHRQELSESAKFELPNMSANNINNRGFARVPTVVGQHKASGGFSQINKVAKEKMNILDKAREKKPDGLTGKKPDGLTGKKPDGLTGKKPDGLTGKKPDGLTGKKPDGLTGKKPDGLTEKKPDGLTGKKPDGLTGKKPDGLTGKKPDGLTGKKHEELTRNTLDGLMGKKPDGLMEKKPDGLMKHEGMATNERRDRANLQSRNKLHSWGNEEYYAQANPISDRKPLDRHEHIHKTNSPFMYHEDERMENRYTMHTNHGSENMRRNEYLRSNHIQYSQQRPPPGINPRVYERGYDF